MGSHKKHSGSKRSTDYARCLVSAQATADRLNDINNYFVNVGKYLAENILPCKSSHCTCNTQSSLSPINSLVISLTDETEIREIIAALREKCAVGTDLISSIIIKRYVPVLIASIVHICNLAITHGLQTGSDKTHIQEWK